MKNFSIPGVTKIQYVLCSDLPSFCQLKAAYGCLVALCADSVEIDFFGTPSLSCEGDIVNNSYVERATLQFSTLQELPKSDNLAFVVTAASGKQYLLGNKEGRFPRVSYTVSSGEPGKSAAARSYKVVHVAESSLVECVL